MLRVYSFLFTIWTLLLLTYNNKDDQIILVSEKFMVKGVTSVGKFNCGYKMKTIDTLFLNNKTGLFYEIPVKKFGCGNFLLTRDFRKTLKHKDHPEVFFNISEIRKKNGGVYSYNLYLKIAGKEKTVHDLVLKKEGNKLKGQTDLKFSDFDLNPPKKLGGAIEVKEDINLSIELKTK